MDVQHFNNLSASQAKILIAQCCSAERWVDQVVMNRPYASFAALQQFSSDSWLIMQEPDFLEAFDGHPKIGELNSKNEKHQSTKMLSKKEQASVHEASEEILDLLAHSNQLYLDRFGFIFIICAAGKSPAKILESIQTRLGNSRTQELKNAAEQQWEIMQQRLSKLFSRH